MSSLKISSVLGFVLISISSFAQEVLLFEKHRGFNASKKVLNFDLLESEVLTKGGDTSISIYNFYYTRDLSGTGLIGNLDISNTLVDILVSCVPLVNVKDKVKLTKLSAREVGLLKIVSAPELLNRAHRNLTETINIGNYESVPLNTFKYQIVLKDGSDYMLVENPILTTFYLVCADRWYFPNEFNLNVLNVARSDKSMFYNLSDLAKVPDYARRKIVHRTYKSKVQNEESLIINHYWTYPDQNYLQLVNIDRRSVYPGFVPLLNFTFIEKIGLTGVRLEFFYNAKERQESVPLNIPVSSEIISINSLDLKSYFNMIKKAVNPHGLIIPGHD